MDFLMSGEDEVLEAITALAGLGYMGVQLRSKPNSHWLSIFEDHAPGTAAALCHTVLSLDPKAVRI